MTAQPTTPTQPWQPDWKPDWLQVRQHMLDWWAGKGLVLRLHCPRDQPRDRTLVGPTTPPDMPRRWLDPEYRARRNEYMLNQAAMLGDFIPIANTNVGAGDLAAMLGSNWSFAPSTVWYTPCIDDPDRCPPLTFDSQDPAFVALADMVRRCVEVADGRYFVGIPDLIENLDILSAMRDPIMVMMDMIERPGWLLEKIDEINLAWFAAFEAFYDIVKAPDGSCTFAAFDLWGPGKTAKVQCDAAAMISRDMFKQFVVPALTRQCQWLDHAMYHLDGEEAMNCLDALLEIEPLNAIEWTPHYLAADEGGGHPKWHDMYRRILSAGKSVQAIGVKPEQIIPLLDSVGGQGMYIVGHAQSQSQAQTLIEQAQAYR